MKSLPFLLILILSFGCCIPPPEEGIAPVFQPTEEEPSIEQAEPDTTEPAPHSEEEQPLLESEDITYYSAGWDIHATLYPAQSSVPTKAIILVPMLDHDRTSYPQSFIKRLHDEMPDALVLAIDSRGHGESTSLGTWQDFDKFMFKDMQNDIIDAKKPITPKYPTVKEYYVVGASIGSTSTILAGARDRDIKKIVMLSPGMEYKEVNIERAVDDYLHPLLLVAASGDSYSANSVDEIESLSSSHIIKKIYSGSAHGTDLFDATKSESETLDDVILAFLKK